MPVLSWRQRFVVCHTFGERVGLATYGLGRRCASAMGCLDPVWWWACSGGSSVRVWPRGVVGRVPATRGQPRYSGSYRGSCGLVVFLTELTSNLATTATFLPVIAAIAAQSGIEPLVLCVPVTLAASCAFMLPVATPPMPLFFRQVSSRFPKWCEQAFFMNLVALGSDAARHACCSSRILVSSGVFKESRARRGGLGARVN